MTYFEVKLEATNLRILEHVMCISGCLESFQKDVLNEPIIKMFKKVTW